jgi:DNA mismatch repair protein PMS2
MWFRNLILTEIRLQDFGRELIEVADNGTGIPTQDYEAIGKTVSDLADPTALKYHTSKISNYDDLSTVSSFGFRGK